MDVDILKLASDFANKEDATMPCTPAAICDAAYDKEARAVVSIQAIDLTAASEGGVSGGFCTGSLVNSATGGKTYLLTADHCFKDKKDLDQFRNWVLVFNYNATSCDSTEPAPIQNVMLGTKLLFYDSESDVALLELQGNVPASFGATALGFQVSEDPPAAAVGIHHPNGNVKKISYANSTNNGGITSDFKDTDLQMNDETVVYTGKTHFQVHWSQGATQGGSSGSPLIDVGSRKVTAVLTGGDSECAGGEDVYGKLSAAWGKGLRNYLQGTGVSKATNKTISLTDLTSSDATDSLGIEGGLDAEPSVLLMPGEKEEAHTQVWLVDPPARPLTVAIELETYPGSAADAADLVDVSPRTLTFSPENHAQPQAVTVRRKPGSADVSARFDLLFLTGSEGDDIGVKVILAPKFEQVSSFVPSEVPALPFAARGAALATPSGNALWSYTPSTNTTLDLEVCLQPGVMEETAVVLLDEGEIAGVLGDGVPGEGDCLTIAGIEAEGGRQLTVLVADADVLSAVVPVSVVESISMEESSDAPPPT